MTGIYVITCTATGEKYIGQSVAINGDGQRIKEN